MPVYIDASKYIETLRLVRQRLLEHINAGALIPPEDLSFLVRMVEVQIENYEGLFGDGEES